MIIGETIIDEYNFCEVLGKSGKEPYLAIKPKKIETYLGGAAAIANHVSDFVRNINLVTHIGTKNEYKDFIKSKLISFGSGAFVFFHQFFNFFSSSNAISGNSSATL